MTAYIRRHKLKTDIARNARINHGRYSSIFGEKGKVIHLMRLVINLAMLFPTKADFLSYWTLIGERIYEFADGHGDEFNEWGRTNPGHNQIISAHPKSRIRS